MNDAVLALLATVAAYLAWQRQRDGPGRVTAALANPTDRDGDTVPDGLESSISEGGTETAVNRPTFERLSGGVA